MPDILESIFGEPERKKKRDVLEDIFQETATPGPDPALGEPAPQNKVSPPGPISPLSGPPRKVPPGREPSPIDALPRKVQDAIYEISHTNPEQARGIAWAMTSLEADPKISKVAEQQILQQLREPFVFAPIPPSLEENRYPPTGYAALPRKTRDAIYDINRINKKAGKRLTAALTSPSAPLEEKQWAKRVILRRRQKLYSERKTVATTLGQTGKAISLVGDMIEGPIESRFGTRSYPHRVAQLLRTAGEMAARIAGPQAGGVFALDIAAGLAQLTEGDREAGLATAETTAVIGALKILGKSKHPVAKIAAKLIHAGIVAKSGYGAAAEEYKRTGSIEEAVEAGLAVGGGVAIGLGARGVGRGVRRGLGYVAQRGRPAKILARERYRLRLPVAKAGEPERPALRAKETISPEYVEAPPKRLRKKAQARLMKEAEEIVKGAKEMGIAAEKEKILGRRRRRAPMPGERLAPEMLPPEVRRVPKVKPKAEPKETVSQRLIKLAGKPAKEITPEEKQFVMDVEAGKLPLHPVSDYEAVQHKVPPGMLGGVTGQPPLRSTYKKQIRLIHAKWKDAGITEPEYRQIVSEATRGRTTSIKQLANEEVGLVLKALGARIPPGKPTQRLGKIRKKPVAPKVLRQPEPEAVRREKQEISDAIKEVEAYNPVKFPEEPGKIVKLRVLGKIKRAIRRSWPYQLVSREWMKYETQIDMIAPEGGQTHEILVERQRVAESKSASLATRGHEYLRTDIRKLKITPAIFKRHTQQLVEVAGLRAQPAVLADIVGAWSDSWYRRVLTRYGVTFKENRNPAKMTEARVAEIQQYLKKNFPRVLGKLDSDIMWYRQVGTSLFATANWQETGKALEMRRDYYPGTRDIRHLRGIRAEALSEAAQMERFKAEAREGGLSSRGPKVVGMRAEGLPSEPELRRIKIARERTGGGAPYLAQDIYTKSSTHINSVAQYAGKAKAVRQAKNLLYNTDFQIKVAERFADGDIVLNNIRQFIIAHSGLDYRPQSTLGRAANWLLRKTSLGVLAGKLKIGAYQHLSYLGAMNEIPVKYLAAAEVGKGKLSQAEINKYFPMLKQRLEGGGSLIMTPSLGRGAQELVKLAHFGPRTTFERAMMILIRKVDGFTMRNIAAAHRLWAEGLGHKGETALIEANKGYIKTAARTQPAWNPLALSTLQLKARGDAIQRAMVMFTSQPNQNLNMVAREVIKYRHTKGTFRDKARLVARSSIPLVINALMVTGVEQAWYKLLGYKRELSWVEFTSAVLSRAYGGWLVMAPIVDNVKSQLISRLGHKKAEVFIAPRHSPLTESIDLISKVVGIWATTIESALTGAEYKSGPKKGDPKFDTQVIHALRQTSNFMAHWFGLPTQAIEQIVRPQVRKLGERRR